MNLLFQNKKCQHKLYTRIILLCGIKIFTIPQTLAQNLSPYDTKFEILRTTEMNTTVELNGTIITKLERGTKPVTLRWCRPEIPFKNWAFGGAGTHRSLLNERVCEISANGHVGFVSGKALQPR